MTLKNNYQIYQKISNTLGEGLHVTSQGVYWLDIIESKLFYSPQNKIIKEYILPEQASAIWKIDQNLIYLISESGICTLDLTSKEWSVLALIPDNEKSIEMRTNDGNAIDDKHYFFGTMHKAPIENSGALYTTHGNEIVKVLDGIGIPNSFIKLNENSFLVSDSFSSIIYLLKFNEIYTDIIEKKMWLDLSNKKYTPDGGCIDSEGNVYIAMWDGSCVNKYDQNANLIKSLLLPVPRPTNCKLSSDKKSIFVTSAREGLSEKQLSLSPDSGSVFEIRL
jgi:sugar lactone lactonase YvrE